MASARTYDQIAYTALGAPAASITFSSIAASWTDLQIILTPIYASGGNYSKIQFNGDTATNYSHRYLAGDRTSVTGGSTQTTAQILTYINASGSTTIPGVHVIDIFQYANTTPYKTVISQNSVDISASGTASISCGLWRNTAAITSIALAPAAGNYAIGTTAALYGIKAA